MRVKMLKLKIGTLIICLAVIGCAQQKVAQQDPRSGSRAFGKTTKVYADIKVIEVKQKIDRGEDIILLDVRTDKEFKSGHLKNAVHIPITQLKDRIHELDREKETIVYCYNGFRSRAGGNVLVSEGFKKVRNMAAGIQGWKYEIVK
jgi:rhodanese-related sulfurtransferase